MEIKELQGNRLLISREKKAETTNYGIYIPPSKQESRNIGLVTMVGVEADAKFLDKQVMFNPNVGQQLDEQTVVIFAKDVIAIL